jgi:hypothetical protein
MAIVHFSGWLEPMPASWARAKAALGGATLEVVRGGGAVFLVDEDGRARGLDPNGPASDLAGVPLVGLVIMMSPETWATLR